MKIKDELLRTGKECKDICYPFICFQEHAVMKETCNNQVR